MYCDGATMSYSADELTCKPKVAGLFTALALFLVLILFSILLLLTLLTKALRSKRREQFLSILGSCHATLNAKFFINRLKNWCTVKLFLLH